MNQKFVHKLPQDENFINHCYRMPSEFKTTVELGDIGDVGDLVPALMMSACAVSDLEVGNDHLLDGYSWCLFAYLVGGDQKGLEIELRPVRDDEQTRLKERGACYKPVKYGLFTGKTPWWKKLFCCGRLGVLATTGRAVDRPTAHQPIYYPDRGLAVFPTTLTSPTFYVDLNVGLSVSDLNKSYFESVFKSTNKNVYTCMHPCYDYATKSLLTYTFLHSKLSKKTTVWFYTFAEGGGCEPIKFVIPHRATLHMFGFTKRYFVLFSTVLQLRRGGTGSVMCGVPIFRVLDDDFCGNLFIHLIPRDGVGATFSIDTRQKGFVYHSINCFDFEGVRSGNGGSVVVDAFVSKSNGSRESSQLELGSEPVYDNEGDAFRFHIHPFQKNMDMKLMVSVLDSSIDFHCINPLFAGREYHNWYMVAHRRYRDIESGKIRLVESILYHLRIVPGLVNDPLSFDPETTAVDVISSTSWTDRSVYLRTPMFVPFKGDSSENEGVLFCWAYEASQYRVGLITKLMIFTTDLKLIKSISMVPNVIPYSVHSYIHLLAEHRQIPEI